MVSLQGFLDSVAVYLGMLLSVAYFTLLERKVLASFHMRKGPMKVGFAGLCQPLADAIKLFSKEFFVPHSSYKFAFFWAPGLAMMISYFVWRAMYPLNTESDDELLGYDLLLFFAISSLNVYVVMVAGWASNSKYASLAANRGFAQAVSYEVVMSMTAFCYVGLAESFNLHGLKEESVWPGLLFLPLSFAWLTVALAETNRAPFDFVEAESELVSGYTVEYGSVGFALLFIAEYANVLMMSYVTGALLCGGHHYSYVSDLMVSMLKTLGWSYWFIWARASLPRYRYDTLMMICWKSFLPFVLVCYIYVTLFAMVW